MGITIHLKKLFLMLHHETLIAWHALTKAKPIGVHHYTRIVDAKKTTMAKAVEAMEGKVIRPMAVLVDALVEVPKVRGTNKMAKTDDVFLTGAQISDQMRKKWLVLLQDGRARVIVFAWDDPERVPKHKQPEQKSRGVKAKKARVTSGRGLLFPYPDGSRIVRGGIIVPPEDGEHEVTQLIDLARLRMTRHMRKKLCDFLRDEFIRERAAILPPGTAVIMDYDPAGPWVFTSTSAMQRKDFQHMFGEADLMLVFWCRVLRHMDIFVHSVDGDIIILLLNYVYRHPDCGDVLFRWAKNGTTKPRAAKPKVAAAAAAQPKKKRQRGLAFVEFEDEDERKKNAVDWDDREAVLAAVAATKEESKEEAAAVPVESKGNKKKVDGYVDIKQLVAILGKRVWPLTVATILCGTDFHDKSSLLNGIGDGKMLMWAMTQASANMTPENEWDFSTLLHGQYTSLEDAEMWEFPLASDSFLHAWRQLTFSHDVEKWDYADITKHLPRRRQGATSLLTCLESITASKPGALKYTVAGATSFAWNLQYWLMDLSWINRDFFQPTTSSRAPLLLASLDDVETDDEGEEA